MNASNKLIQNPCKMVKTCFQIKKEQRFNKSYIRFLHFSIFFIVYYFSNAFKKCIRVYFEEERFRRFIMSSKKKTKLKFKFFSKFSIPLCIEEQVSGLFFKCYKKAQTIFNTYQFFQVVSAV